MQTITFMLLRLEERCWKSTKTKQARPLDTCNHLLYLLVMAEPELGPRGAHFLHLPSLFSLSLLLPLFSFFLLFTMPKFLREACGGSNGQHESHIQYIYNSNTAWITCQVIYNTYTILIPSHSRSRSITDTKIGPKICKHLYRQAFGHNIRELVRRRNA